MLFKKLPDEIFKPLAGPNRYLFEEILLFLFRYFSDEELTNQAIFPRRAMVKSEIEELLARKGRLLNIIREDEASGEVISDAPGPAAEYIYRRLVVCGWLEEEIDGYNVNVLMPPHASLLLEALEGVANSEKKSYGGTVASINAQLDFIVKEPLEYARAFAEVVRATRDFTRHLQNILSGLRGFQDIIANQRDPRQMLATFFDDFVENLLISDYRSLQSENSPFRHRGKVRMNLQFIEYTESILEAIAKVYQEDKQLSPETARERVIQDLHFIGRVFQSVDQRLRAIDIYRSRLESRVTEMVRYLDRSVPDMTARGQKLLEFLGAASRNAPDGELADLPAPARWLSVMVLGPRSFRRPQKRREPQYVELPPKRELDPKVIEIRRQAKAYLSRRAMNPTRVAAFFGRQMEGKTSMSAKDFNIETIEDLVAFAFAPFVNQNTLPVGSPLRKFVIRKTGKQIENEWLEGPDFIVERKD